MKWWLLKAQLDWLEHNDPHEMLNAENTNKLNETQTLMWNDDAKCNTRLTKLIIISRLLNHGMHTWFYPNELALAGNTGSSTNYKAMQV